MKILDVAWFTTCGIVRVDTEYDGIKYYIRAINGMDEKSDARLIADYGSTFPNDAGDVLFGIK